MVNRGRAGTHRASGSGRQDRRRGHAARALGILVVLPQQALAINPLAVSCSISRPVILTDPTVTQLFFFNPSVLCGKIQTKHEQLTMRDPTTFTTQNRCWMPMLPESPRRRSSRRSSRRIAIASLDLGSRGDPSVFTKNIQLKQSYHNKQPLF